MLISIFLICQYVKGQTDSQLDSLINKSFISFIENRKELINKGIIHKEYFKNLYFLIDNLPRNFQFCKQIQDMGFSYFTLINPNTRNMKKGQGYIVIFTDISIINGKLIIALSDRSITRIKRNHIGIAISDWGDYVYEYSCEKQKWILLETKWWNITLFYAPNLPKLTNCYRKLLIVTESY